MPLLLNNNGAIANWLDTRSEKATYSATDGLRPAGVRLVAAKVQSECRWKLLTTSNAQVLGVLNRFVGSSRDENTRQRDGKVHYTTEQIDTWNELADFILAEIATHSNRLKEIELAMVVVKSPVILGTINSTITAVEKLMMAVRLSRGASLTGQEYNKDKLATTTPSRENKFYLPWTQHKSVDSVLGDAGAGFTLRMALLHDLMEFAVMMFKSKDVQKVFNFMATPMAHPETVTTSTGVEARDKDSEPRSIFYAKSLHCPVECGPSYTTCRLLRLPDTLSILTKGELGAPPPVNPVTRVRGVRVVPHAPGYLRLSPEQKGHIAWGIFGWWTLNFPKHWGTGAHCFFEVCDAARSCGSPIVDRPGVYPTRAELCTRLQVRWTPADTAELERRKRLLIAGTEQTRA